MIKPSKETKKKIQEMLRPIAKDLIFTQAVAEELRVIVDGIKTKILQENEFFNERGERVLEPRWDWKINPIETAKVYFALCHDGYIKSGFNVQPGYCPALIAEEELRKVERHLLDVAGKLIDPILAEIHNMEHRRKAIEILCGLALAD